MRDRKIFTKKLLSALTGISLFSVLALSNSAMAKKVWHDSSAGQKMIIQQPSLSPLVKKSGPAVLSIYVEGEARKQMNFFGFGRMAPQKQQSLGSGFLIHEDGYALTNNHVVAHAETIKVRMGDDPKEYTAIVIGTDPSTDVALIKLQGKRKKWPYLPIGKSTILDVGDYVVAIGNPFGLSQTVSLGIISAKHRRDINPNGQNGLYDFIQTDASINPGNSGGPLINLKGEVIGINSAVAAQGQGLGFAVPSAIFTKILPSLLKDGRVQRAWLGIGIQEISPELASGFGLKYPHGALVTSIAKKSPAAKAGILLGDIITAFDGREIDKASTLPLYAAHSGVGNDVKVEINRDGMRLYRQVKMGLSPQDKENKTSRKANVIDDPKEAKTSLGVRLRNLDEDSRRRSGVSRRQKGALVSRVLNDSVAAKAGVQPGDIIVKINGRKITTTDNAIKIIKSIPTNKMIKMKIIRNGEFLIFIPMMKP